MATGPRLVLSFTKHRNAPAVLTRTQFAPRDGVAPLELSRGLYGRTFKWTAGVKALSVLLLRTAATALRRVTVSGGPYVLRGRRRTPAASLNDALTKQHAWIFDMFGPAGAAAPSLRQMVRRENPDFQTDPSAPVGLWLDSGVFPAERIEITLNGQPVCDAVALEGLAEEIAGGWKRAAEPLSSKTESMATLFGRIAGSSGEEQLIGLETLMADGVEWELVGGTDCPIRGRWHGKAAVMAAARMNLVRMREHHPRVGTVVEQDGTIIILLDESFFWEPANSFVCVRAAQRFTLGAGRITHMYYLHHWQVLGQVVP